MPDFLCSPLFYLPPFLISLQQCIIHPTGLLRWPTQLQSTLMPVMISFVVVPLRCLMNQASVMEAPPTLSQRKDMVGTMCGQFSGVCFSSWSPIGSILFPLQPQPPGITVLAFPSLQTLLFQRALAGEQCCPPSVLTTVMLASWLSCTTT